MDAIVTDDRKREAVALLKMRFISWRRPAVELPPDSVIADVVSTIYDMGREDETDARSYDLKIQDAMHNQ